MGEKSGRNERAAGRVEGIMCGLWRTVLCIERKRQGSLVCVPDKRRRGGPDRPARLRKCAPRGTDVATPLHHLSRTR